MNTTKINIINLTARYILPLLILINTYFFFFDINYSLFFSQISSITIHHIFMIFLAVKSINSWLVIFGHNILKYSNTLLFLMLVQFMFSYVYLGYTNIEGAKIFYQFPFLKWSNSFLVNLIVDSFYLLGSFSIIRKVKLVNEMNQYSKWLFYFFIPFIFYFTFSRSFTYFNINHCKSEYDKILFQTDGQKEALSPLNGLEIQKVIHFNAHQFDESKKYVVYLMDSNCKRCWRGMANIKSLAALNYELIFFDVGENEHFIQEYSLDRESNYYPIIYDESLILTFPDLPTTIIIEKNIIQKIFPIDTPSTYELLF